MQKTLLLACNNETDARGLREAFYSIDKVRLLPVAFNGRDAVDALLTQDVDLLLLDLFLPELDGIGVLDVIEQMDENRRPLVFVMTTLPDDRLLYRIRDKIVYCFTKPLSYEIVQLRVLETMHAAFEEPEHGLTQIDLLEQLIYAGIRAIGMPPHLKGYYYVRDAIRLFATSSAPTEISIMRDIYPVVAKLYNTRPPLVEHAMRNAIEITWTRGDLKTIHEFFGFTVNDNKGKPTNLEFIATMAQRALQYVKKR